MPQPLGIDMENSRDLLPQLDDAKNIKIGSWEKVVELHFRRIRSSWKKKDRHYKE